VYLNPIIFVEREKQRKELVKKQKKQYVGAAYIPTTMLKFSELFKPTSSRLGFARGRSERNRNIIINNNNNNN
jgi:hypothetical protein